jgi:hypothetical protein
MQAVERAFREPEPDRIAQGIAKAEHASWNAIVLDMERDIREALRAEVSPTKGAFAAMEISR